jgi:methionyl-tRNA synthetase
MKHGIKIEQKAKEAGISPQEFCGSSSGSNQIQLGFDEM